MYKKLRRFITLVLALALITTNFGSDFASARAYAVADEDELEVTVDSSEIGDIFEDISDVETSEESEEDEEEIVDAEGETEVDNSTAEAATEEATLAEEKSEGLENIIEESVKESSAEGEAVAAIFNSTEESNAATLASSDAAAFSSSEDAATLASSDAAALASSDAAALASSEEEKPIEFSPDPVILNGVKITLYAVPGVLPNDAELQVSEIESDFEDKITEAIDEDTGADVEVVKTISYDIKIYSESEGDFVQPEDGTVRVTFEEIDEASDEEIALAVYHVEESGDEVENVDEVKKGEENSTDTEIGFDAEHFSIYTIAFLKQSGDKAAKFQLDPVDENGKAINISNYGETIKEIDSDESGSPEKYALKLPGYEYVRAYYEKNIDGTRVEANVTLIEVDTSNKKLIIKTEYNGNNYSDSFDWVDKEKINKPAVSDIPVLKFVYKNNVKFKDSELIYFFLLIPDKSVPLTSEGDVQWKYFPSYGSNGYEGGLPHYGQSDIDDKWVGRALSLALVDDADKDDVISDHHGIKTGNVYDLSGAKVEKYITEKPTDKINAYLASEFPGFGFDNADFTENDVVWYVYKNQLDAFHIDGFLNSAVRYNTNFGTPVTSTETVKFLTDYHIKDYGDVFSVSRDGYTFVGWSPDPDDFADNGYLDNISYAFAWNGKSHTQTVDVNQDILVGPKLTLYAQWKKDGVLDANIEVWAKDDEWFYDGTDHTNNEILKQTSDDPNYEVTAIETNGKVKNVSDTSNLNNKITKVTIKDKTTGKEYTFTVNGNSEVVTINGEKTKVTVHNSTLTIKPRTVTLTSENLSKEFDGKYLTADERYKAGVTTARNITPNAYDAKNGTGFVPGEGIDNDKIEFTGKLIDIKLEENANTFKFDKALKSNTLTENYAITPYYGSLEITVGKKIQIKIKLKANAEGDGRNTYRIYNGGVQQGDMTVHIEIEGEHDGDIDSFLQTIIEALKNGAASVLNAGTLVVHAEGNPGDPIAVEPETKTVAGMDITVSGLMVRGGAGTDVGHYPIFLDYSGMHLETVIDGKTIDLTKLVEITPDHETAAKEMIEYNVNPAIKTGEEIIGWLHVTQREVVMLSDTASKQYDGTPLTAKHVSETEYVVDKNSNKGFVPGEGADYDITGSLVGSATETQSVRNDYTYTLKSNTKASNYIITQEYGTLTVTPLGGGDNPPSDPDPDPDPPTTTTVVPPSPVAAVLGARRAEATSGAAVLGARRAATEDATNEGMRVLVVVIAAGIAISLLFFGKKKENDEV
ncbi:hypothetical protein SAMN02910276_02305 [Butyrivibrio sp. Su6]|uniref:hypothetical protein n=1 Tax=Butyrivibrio sp. Su6 TaxID=1520810 RepID=UPI00089E1A71|nr:hypothetical protein [Butyrivibrio sp. Su6]SEG24987.1 hypothetical protein SAMN02910276_02305 [Butyrivibrio sp. Su6]